MQFGTNLTNLLMDSKLDLMDYTQLISSLTKIFLTQDRYLFDKHVPEFESGGRFLGDCFVQTTVEPKEDKPPRFYHHFSPFDVISTKSPERLLVYEAGELLLDIDFTDYVTLRTAAMSTVVLKGVGMNTLKNKRVLVFGGGKIANVAIKILASQLELQEVDVVTRSGNLTALESELGNTGVRVSAGDINKSSDYDVIICHTNTESPLLQGDQLKQIKPGAFLASFISSTEHGELPDSAYDGHRANIIVDWDKTVLGAKDMQRAQASGLFVEGALITVRDLLQTKKVDLNKQYTVYRSTGSPIQNLAVVKELLK